MNEYLMFFIALLPIVLLIVSLGVFKIPGHKICPIALVLTIVLSIIGWKMPLGVSLSAALEGIVLALWPIMLVIIAAVFTYNLSVHTKGMETIKKILTSVTTDKRILVLILAWGFGGFLESVAGFGTAVAIPASILIVLGFDPIFAAIICLVANTTPTAFGAIGLPINTLSKLANLTPTQLSNDVSIQLFLFVVFIPMALVMITGKSFKAVKGVIGITLASGIAFAIPQAILAKYLGAELPAVLGSVASLAVTIWMAKTFHKDKQAKNIDEKVSFKSGVIAWSPFILILVLILLSSPLFPSINVALSSIKTSVHIYQGQDSIPYTFTWIGTPGVLILISGFIGGAIQGANFKEMLAVLGRTVKQMSKSGITILSIIALAKVMGYSGMIKSIAVILVMITGRFYPVIAPLIGALGTFITGSATSSNVLFGGLQVEAAKSLAIDPCWLAAANTAGATAGKIISPQSIAVATAATGIAGEEGKILNSTLKFFLAYVIIQGIITFFGAAIF